MTHQKLSFPVALTPTLHWHVQLLSHRAVFSLSFCKIMPIDTLFKFRTLIFFHKHLLNDIELKMIFWFHFHELRYAHYRSSFVSLISMQSFKPAAPIEKAEETILFIRVLFYASFCKWLVSAVIFWKCCWLLSVSFGAMVWQCFPLQRLFYYTVFQSSIFLRF